VKNIPKDSSTKTSVADSTSKEKGFFPFWNKSCQEISNLLWLDIKTDSRGSVSILSDGSVSKKIANSWFSVEQSCLQSENLLKISCWAGDPPSCQSSIVSVADSTDCENINLLSKKIRVYPEPELARIWKQWIAASRWCYNQAINHLKTNKIGKYDLRKLVMSEVPEWVDNCPYNPRQAAVFQAFDAHKAAKKSGGFAKYRSRFDVSKTIKFQTSNWKNNTFYPQITKGLTYKSAEAINKINHDPTLSLINGQWFICHLVETLKPMPTVGERVLAIDPGIRTFITGFEGSHIIEIGKGDIGRIYRLCSHLDKLMSKIGLSKGSAFKRLRFTLRKASAKIRIKIKCLISELHKKSADYIATTYKTIFLPKFETSQMVCKASRKINKKSARAMMTLSHYQFKQTLKHQATKYGSSVVDITEEYTSKTCSKCGHIHQKLGSKKKYVCPSCGHSIPRDVNGAINIMLKALGDTPWLEKSNLLYSVTTERRELPD
jgi:putative transposase